MEKSDTMLIKATATYCTSMIELLPYFLMRFFNFIENFFSFVVFCFYDILISIQDFPYIPFFLYSFCGSGLSWCFLFTAEFFLLFLIEALILFLACKVKITLIN